jgi:glycosyltransferase involved in cell wall biosynthesis
LSRVLAILHQFPPDRAVGAQSCAQICRYLPTFGWDVTVLTVREDYFAPEDRAAADGFSGTVVRTRVMPHPFEWYRWLKSRAFQHTSATQQPATSPIPVDRGGLRRSLRALLEVPDPYTGWMPPAIFRGLHVIRKQRVDCLFSSGPWWTNHLVAWSLAQATGLPWVAHFRDSWAQGHWVKSVTPFSVRIEKALERMVIRKAQAVVSVTDMQTEMLRGANPDLPQSKFTTIPNGYDDAEWAPAAARPHNKKFVITYAGNFYHGRSPYSLFRALRCLIDGGRIQNGDIDIELLGMCDVAEGSGVMETATALGVASCVSMPGVLPKMEAIRRMQSSDLLLLLVDEQNYSIPAKTYEYLRAGRPILALTTGGAVVDLLRQTGGAWVVDPADIAGIQSAVMEAYSAWKHGTDARLPDADVVRSYDRRLLSGRIADVLNTVSRSSSQMRARITSTMRSAV